MTQISFDTIFQLLSILPVVVFFLLSKFFFDCNKDIRKDYRIEINENRRIILEEHQVPKMVILCEKTFDLYSKSDFETIEETVFSMAADNSNRRYIESVNAPITGICRLMTFYFNLRDISFHLSIVFLVVFGILLFISISVNLEILDSIVKYLLYILLSISLLIIYLLANFFRAKKSFDLESDQISLGLKEVV